MALAICDYGGGKVGWIYATTAEVAGADRLEVVGERGVLGWPTGALSPSSSLVAPVSLRVIIS